METFVSSAIDTKFSYDYQFFVNDCLLPLSMLVYKHKPPEAVKEIYALLRYTSMFPLVKTKGVISTIEQFLEKGEGNVLEHALYFCNCLLYLGHDASIFIADDMFLGQCAFVYTIENDRQMFYDPVNNKAYCGLPFRRVYIAFNQQGVWVNDDDDIISLDFINSSNWRNVHMNNKEHNKSEIDIVYDTLETDVDLIKSILVDYIRNYISNLINEKIKWNKSLISNLEYIINTCEEAIDKRSYPDEADFLSEGSLIRATGAPFCINYSSSSMTMQELVKSIEVKIYQQKMYIITGPKTKLGLAVKVFSKPNALYAIWVFVASIQQLPKKLNI